MALLNQRGRDPLLDIRVQAAIERRTKELIGVALFVLGAMAALMLVSYSADDPNWWISTDGAVQNIMGRTGAAIAAPLLMIIGLSSWGIVAAFLVWGLRLIFHCGDERALGRLIFLPVAIALAAVCVSNLHPGSDWSAAHSFGLGGLFGDTVSALLLTLLPVESARSVTVVWIALGFLLVGVASFTLGFTRTELSWLFRRSGRYIVLFYSGLLRTIELLAGRTLRVARNSYETYVFPATDHSEHPEAMMATLSRGHRVKTAIATSGGNIARKEPQLVATESPKSDHNAGSMEGEDIEGLAAGTGGEGLRAASAYSEDRITRKISAVIADRMSSFYGQVVPDGTSEVEDPKYSPAPLIYRPNVEESTPSEPELSAPGQFEPTNEPPISEQVLPIEAPEVSPQLPSDSGRVVLSRPKSPLSLSRRARAEAQPPLAFEDHEKEFELPPLGLLANPTEPISTNLSSEALEENARMLEVVLDDYGVKGEIVAVRPGPVVTMYELEPAPGLKASRVIGLADDIARSMSALSARVSTVPGRSVIGIELPNDQREKVVLRKILSSQSFGDSHMRLPLALGKDIGGNPVVANLARMPHLLIAGTTGSGKSVAINTMILSLLYKLTPNECRLIMIDPKMLELSVYDGIPHLLSPVVTDPKKALVALKWVVGEMEERYRKMSKMGVRNIEGFNGRVREALAKDEMFVRTVQTGFDDETGEPIFESEESTPEVLPYIVVIVDEMADLMMVAGKEIEACIQRLAQMARASGIHLIMATQRPSVDVITGTIKANFPTRISFQVTSKIDSRTILGEMGAEQLLGMGDMLYMAGGAKIMRCHGPFVSDEEVEVVVKHLKAYGSPEYVQAVVDGPDEGRESDIDRVLGLGGNDDGADALYDQAVQIVLADRKCSTSYIQRKLSIGYNKAARLVEQMEDQGLISAANHVGKREILIPEP
ncbi:MAG: DNA translocase FtsK 4TM domain-containing protein [Aestuariivita sp.]|nr:DNA translocase FtsK 4TM domain-containing protein [Aestuariivita sp.]MCY4203317.1 DNA translocase FtsK 4TM domain-containing protein [Aestuariivita sp.]